MKKIIAGILSLTMLFSFFACSSRQNNDEATTQDSSFSSLSDPELQYYLKDEVYVELIANLGEGYFIENVDTVYVSKEYIEELEYNSQSNIYFGFTLAEVEDVFGDTQYVFTLNEDGTTTVKEFVPYQNVFNNVLKDIGIGAGVILICVTVSLVTASSAPAISMIFACSAKHGALGALTGGAISGITAGIIEGIETNDFQKALEAATISAAEGFKWGAISGVIEGGMTEAIKLKGATLNGLTMSEAAKIQMESGYPLDVIKQFQTMEQYEILKNAGVTTKNVNGKVALVRSINLNYVDEFGRTNLQRMNEGLAPLDPTGLPYELHHIGQKNDSTLAILTRSEHRQGGNHEIWHYVDDATDNPSSQGQWTATRADFWKSMGELLGGS